ncbi:alpha-galactosidase [Vibrio sp. DW001]|uniref:alpha-galactosidase n=1 Tax=Vibrio sp. DW001 TaxID=2912315 RepID=UPI0023B1BCF9|nr:alpha-galactosidase [Vibrio sp. DW001]WED28849.1 alpha-galactosidase [Vibrio sp. DW001]
MGIEYNKAHKVFHLKGKQTSYIFGVNVHGYLQHIYWGGELSLAKQNDDCMIAGRMFSDTECKPDNIVSIFECVQNEFPFFGTGDYKSPAFSIVDHNGHSTSELKYLSHRINRGKPDIEGLPSTYMETKDEGETLHVVLEDKYNNFIVELSYTLFEELDVVTRSARFINLGIHPLELTRALSVSIDMPDHDFDCLQLWGAWGNERNIDRTTLSHGKQVIESKRGSSSHQKNPFVALLRKETTEDTGDIYGFSLVYSGSFIAEVDVEQYEFSRVNMGINPYNFKWKLKQGESFQTPEVVLVYSSEGLGGMSRKFHKLYRTRLCRGKYRDKARPVLINNWEATYFDFDEKKLMDIAGAAKKVGIELFVLDDGWFGNRNSDNSSLGDWVENRDKIPSGLNKFANLLNKQDMKFGLWFEPEMISPDSELYRSHPDWCLHVAGRPRTEVRNQLVLDLSRVDVQDYIIDTLNRVLSSCNIEYVKWDFNRELMEIGNVTHPVDQQQELGHRYILGLYRVMGHLTQSFPHILFEGCASGGGRYDPGMLYYMPQIWASDNTDSISRLSIQYGTSLVYPACTMGAHVSDSPNHQTGRRTLLQTRGQVAMAGCFGYELDLSMLSTEALHEISTQVQEYKSIRNWIIHSDLYRLHSPISRQKCAWMYVSEDKSRAIVQYVKILTLPVRINIERIKLKGLSSTKLYHVVGDKQVYTGSELMKLGLDCSQLTEDFCSQSWIINEYQE